MNVIKTLAVALIASLPVIAMGFGTDPQPVSEPGTLSLLALGVAAAAVIAIRKRRK